MASSYVREARRRGLGMRRERIDLIQRLAKEHSDAEIAVSFWTDLELLASVDTDDVNVNRVSPALLPSTARPKTISWSRRSSSEISTQQASSGRRRRFGNDARSDREVRTLGCRRGSRIS